ncbi:guanitoxin biosynthesis heme-dependent pre-guanitoxin N-hydroxylase GntA [Chryseobacterium wangxinyae]|uniref:guanitoxin biosynthesis heme-dependent pre-guanitoxin N-hydroxylase GntA n=1 Tax=Chryseobacterium sp. CY350 TaxID=2997336 RepID=UPI0022719361|nr:guanitoxin biosynthesis heme-dependent pre-guanitoxin N-hydroxylase GntA [Chryseobacterium sp. CY350]MCY0976897.1 YqcI/YcgG family protein [Chryseobacterium sp. CY350]WBZ96896.1 guanitoxin biosynthesis heme-dependent pre-guanitoxin N-hydroxylase GntA [Chryseobacterium sp. CY350]
MKAIVQAEAEVENIENQYKDFILNGQHPCIMAKAMFKMDKYHLHVYDDMHNPGSLELLIANLYHYISQYNFEGNSFESFLAVFPNNHFKDEISFEKNLWITLQKLHELDDCEWDERVSDDPDNPYFSFSLKGRAFYIIGMHPSSSRIARKAPYTTLVFNLHWQFDKLREMGTYHAVRDTIRKNDQVLQGSINPVLKDFGDDSETRQYSGRNVEAQWKCPFHKKTN